MAPKVEIQTVMLTERSAHSVQAALAGLYEEQGIKRAVGGQPAVAGGADAAVRSVIAGDEDGTADWLKQVMNTLKP